jgi:hypothetical protein
MRLLNLSISDFTGNLHLDTLSVSLMLMAGSKTGEKV